MPAIEPESNERREAFDAHVAAEGKVEPQDWMPGAYRKTLVNLFDGPWVKESFMIHFSLFVTEKCVILSV